MPGIESATADRRRDDKTNPEKELLTRLEQVIDWYASTNGKLKSRAMTAAIDLLTKRKVEIDSAPREAPLLPRSAH